MLQRGSKGAEVKGLQRDLYPRYYHGRIDGDYGPMTEAAVRAFQQDRFVTGRADDVTLWEIDWASVPAERQPPIVEKPKNRRALERIFGRIEYESQKSGSIRIINNFVIDNIVNVELPIVGKKYVHRLLVEHFVAALQRVELYGCADQIKTFGTFVPRHVLWNPSKPLSLHSYGIAVDINARNVPYGSDKRLPRGIVEAFVGVGFRAGETFRTPDPMHFDYYGF